ncbi:hypothetical protein B0T18DRAFT_416192 [Schizothecium vesticola]|uniref:Uncharacterized protein n=1 Tax=Schizothecium vesticola TaxID=314040 RepID=A0AA40ER61_9PEZI|nr:hypothetical protein B0T18DRAFT_416192 [Schizothecium vesticola]
MTKRGLFMVKFDEVPPVCQEKACLFCSSSAFQLFPSRQQPPPEERTGSVKKKSTTTGHHCCRFTNPNARSPWPCRRPTPGRRRVRRMAASLLSWTWTLSHAHQSLSCPRGKRVLGSQPTDIVSGVGCAPSPTLRSPLDPLRTRPPHQPWCDTMTTFRLACLLQPVHPCWHCCCCCCCCKSRKGGDASPPRSLSPSPSPSSLLPCRLLPRRGHPVSDQAHLDSDLPCYIMGWSRLSGTLALPLSLVAGVGRFRYHVNTSSTLCRSRLSGFPWHAMLASVRPVGR